MTKDQIVNMLKTDKQAFTAYKNKLETLASEMESISINIPEELQVELPDSAEWRIRIDLSDTDLSNTDLRDLNLSNMIFIGTNLTNADLTGSSLSGSDFCDAIFDNTCFEDTDNRCTIYKEDLHENSITGEPRFMVYPSDTWNTNSRMYKGLKDLGLKA